MTSAYRQQLAGKRTESPATARTAPGIPNTPSAPVRGLQRAGIDAPKESLSEAGHRPRYAATRYPDRVPFAGAKFVAHDLDEAQLAAFLNTARRLGIPAYAH